MAHRPESVTFRGSLGGTNSSTRFLSASKDGDMRIVLEAPASEAAHVLGLLLMGDRELKITVEVDS